MLKGIRGAITAESNTTDSIREAAIELFTELINKNSLSEENVSYVEFSVTKDLDAIYHEKFVR